MFELEEVGNRGLRDREPVGAQVKHAPTTGEAQNSRSVVVVRQLHELIEHLGGWARLGRQAPDHRGLSRRPLG